VKEILSRRLTMKVRMKRVRLILLSCVMVISLLFTGTAYAQDEELQLPSAGITPDSPFYFLDNWGKSMGLFFALGAEAKAKKALEYAEERLAEAHTMAVRKRARALEKATNGYGDYVSLAIQKMEEARKQGVSDNICEIVALATSKHLLVLDRVVDIVPEEAKEAIAQAKGASINGLGNGLRLLAGENPVRAMEINLAAIEGRLNRANAEAEENDTEGVEDAFDDFEELSGFGLEISEMARGLSDNITVDQLVAKATSHHLDVLALVWEKVPGQAKPAIERAMARSIKGHERAVEALEAKGALPEGISDNVTEGIPGEVKKKLLKPEVPKSEVSENEVEEEVEELEEEEEEEE